MARALVGPASQLFTYSDAAALAPGPLGRNPYVENPAVVSDPYNGIDVTVSVGTWDTYGDYYSVEIPCETFSSSNECFPGSGGTFAGLSQSTGGMSYVLDSSPTGNNAVWAYGTPSTPYNRIVWTGWTAAYNNNPPLMIKLHRTRPVLPSSTASAGERAGPQPPGEGPSPPPSAGR